MKREDFLLIVDIILIVGLGIYSYIIEQEPNKFNLVIPLMLILVVFFLFLYLIAKAEARLNQSLNRKLPTVEYMTKDDVEKDLENLAKKASKFIATTGGASRNKDYLKAIEQKVKSGVPYWRVIFNEPISREMCEHLCALVSLQNVSISKIEKGGYSNISAVEQGYIIALPVPGHGQLMGLKIPSADRAQDMFTYLVTLSQGATKISTKEEIEALCET